MAVAGMATVSRAIELPERGAVPFFLESVAEKPEKCKKGCGPFSRATARRQSLGAGPRERGAPAIEAQAPPGVAVPVPIA
jgi:hypothetical protein